jgi:hypothetical protein
MSVAVPEAMERLDFTRLTGVARARMKDKFGAKIYLHRKNGTFRAVTTDGSAEPGSDNPETAPTLEALLKRTKWWGFEDNNKAVKRPPHAAWPLSVLVSAVGPVT